ncbi:PQQ-binding-like beta-propeller repeat protein [Nonomuraea sp. MTCD27]|uniref:outer membrane protein assembly factor BamB family protein n=1 Tax=Nonomuraea sp. MTCD27 TaxID=1676747 RepID=UPI0035C20726
MRLRALIAGALVLACAAGSRAAGPERAGLTAAWSVELGPLGDEGIDLHVPTATIRGRHLLAVRSARPRSVRVHDAGTGRLVSTFPLAEPPLGATMDVRFVGESLAVRVDEGTGQRISLHDPLTGTTTWSRALPYARASALTPTGIAWAAHDGLRGIDPATGRDTWTLPWPPGCAPPDLIGAGLPVLAADCRGKGVLRGVDPRTGQVAWAHEVPGAPEQILNTEVSSTGLITASIDGLLTVLDSRGRLVARVPDTFPQVARTTAVHAGALTLVVHSVAGARLITALRDGRVAWRTSLRPRTGAESLEDHLPGAGHLTARHAVGELFSGLEPGLVEVISLADGTRAVLRLPVAQRAASVVGSTARDVLVYEIHPGGGRLTAYTFHGRTGLPPSLPVPPGSWPDACALLGPAAPPGYLPVPGTGGHLGLRWPRPSTCTFVPPDDAGAQVRVAITWVAATEADVRLLAATKAAADPAVLRLGEGAYLGSEPDRADRRTYAWATGGRILAAVQAVGDPALTRRTALAVAARLRTAGPAHSPGGRRPPAQR